MLAAPNAQFGVTICVCVVHTCILREEVRPIKSEIAIYDFAKYDFAKYINFQCKTH
jgi:hypothetical protein